MPTLTHGMSNLLIYKTWQAMLNRCYNPNTKVYKFYGGRGIDVCERWHQFENFFADMGDRPTNKHTLDRVDNDRGYSLENCRWVPHSSQPKNRRTNIQLTHEGKTQTLAEWSRETGIHKTTLQWRFHQGWPVKNILKEVKRK